MGRVEFIQSDFDNPVLADALDLWRGELERVVGLRGHDLAGARRSEKYADVMRAWQPAIDSILDRIVEIEKLRPPPLMVIRDETPQVQDL